MSRAGGLPGIGGVGLSGQEVSGGRNFGVVSGEAVMNQNIPGMPNQGMPPGMMPDLMSQIAPNLGMLRLTLGYLQFMVFHHLTRISIKCHTSTRSKPTKYWRKSW